MVAEVQKRGGIAAFIDAEHALDPKYAKNIGVDIDELYISQPDTGEQALDVKSGAWYSYQGNKIGQGRETTKAYLEEHKDLLNEIEGKVREYYHLKSQSQDPTAQSKNVSEASGNQQDEDEE